MPELVLGLDVGSTSARALIIDLSGRVHGQAHTRLTSMHSGPGRVEQDPREVWKRVEQTITEALSAAECRAADLGAVGVAAQRSSVVVWDRATGEPLGPMILWSDLRGADRAAVLQAAGHLVHPIAAASKLEAAIDEIDDGRARAAAGELAWGTLDSFLVYRLTGGALHVTDYSNDWSTSYLDLATMKNWNAKLIELQGLPIGLFPELCDTYGPLGSTSASVLGSEIPLGAIVADQQCGMFAHGAWDAGAWKASYGTSATLMVSTSSTPTFAPGLMPMLLATHRATTLFAVEGMVISAGKLLDWLISDLGLFASVEELTRAGASVDSSDGVAIRPALNGIGAPHNDSTRRAEIVGLSSASNSKHIARAAFESVAFRMREIVEAIAAIEGLPVPEVLPVDGGVAANDVFLQIQADVLGRPVDRHIHREATAVGACIAAAVGVGMASRDELAPLTRTATRFEPSIDPGEATARFSQWRSALGEGAGS
jgi:glycerol kinase